MALSLTQGAVAAALVSEGVGGGLGGQVTEPSDYVPPDVNLFFMFYSNSITVNT